MTFVDNYFPERPLTPDALTTCLNLLLWESYIVNICIVKGCGYLLVLYLVYWIFPAWNGKIDHLYSLQAAQSVLQIYSWFSAGQSPCIDQTPFMVLS